MYAWFGWKLVTFAHRFNCFSHCVPSHLYCIWIFFISSEEPYVLDYEYKKHWRLLLNWKGIPITKSWQLILLFISLSNFYLDFSTDSYEWELALIMIFKLCKSFICYIVFVLWVNQIFLIKTSLKTFRDKTYWLLISIILPFVNSFDN